MQGEGRKARIEVYRKNGINGDRWREGRRLNEGGRGDKRRRERCKRDERRRSEGGGG